MRTIAHRKPSRGLEPARSAAGPREREGVMAIKLGSILLSTASLALVFTPGAALAAWTRSFAIEWSEPAMYFGGLGSPVESGADCPNGANPDPDWPQVMIKAGYEPDAARWLFDPSNATPPRLYRLNQMAFRGKGRANVYADPTTTPDPGLVPVAGTRGEGINLDGDLGNGFVSPTGEKGIDNNFYRALGCLKFYRAPRGQIPAAVSGNDSGRSGVWTLVIVASGQGDDPMNDEHVRLGVYLSADKPARNGAGQIAPDYTYRIRPHARYEAIFNGRISRGRITTETTPEIFLRDTTHGYGLQLLKARSDLQIEPDGRLRGYIGGYRPWRPVYTALLALGAPNLEYSSGFQLPAIWYALRRHADYSPGGLGGEKTHISYALRLDAVPAYVTEPDGKRLVASVKSYKTAASPDEALIRHPHSTFQTLDGVILPPGQTAWTPLSDEALRPPSTKPAGPMTAPAP